MSLEDGSDVVAIYRTAAKEQPRASTDAAILGAARRAARRRQILRESAAWLAVAAAVGAVAVGLHRSEPAGPASSAIEVQSYGRFEGTSRSFLLRQSDAIGVGPGSTAFMQIAYSPEEK
jgi:hypothetical protein